mmetsp:Transcript_469/g.1008  ORF Transcript_469/g.1008 Transcript_469/m.1008 type:complete len:230 (+) Transcript_469:699-1388(+)
MKNTTVENARGSETTPKNTRHTLSPTPSVPSRELIASSPVLRSPASPECATPKNVSIATMATVESPPPRLMNACANSSPNPVEGLSQRTKSAAKTVTNTPVNCAQDLSFCSEKANTAASSPPSASSISCSIGSSICCCCILRPRRGAQPRVTAPARPMHACLFPPRRATAGRVRRAARRETVMGAKEKACAAERRAAATASRSALECAIVVGLPVGERGLLANSGKEAI